MSKLQTKNLEVVRDRGGGWEWEWQGDGGEVGEGRRLDRRTTTKRGENVSRQPFATLNSFCGVNSMVGVKTHKTQDVSVSKSPSNTVHPGCQSPVPTITDPLAALRELNERARGYGAEMTGEKGGAETKELDAEGHRLLKSYTAGALCFLVGDL
jgi:hypothetical protein